MTKICTLLELSLVVKKSYCDLELKPSSQQYFNMITARCFTAFHKPLAHCTHCWSFPRLQQQWQVFLLPLIHCKATILLIRRLLRHIFCLLLAAIQENMSRGTPLSQSESAKFPLHFKYSGAQSTWELTDLTGVISNGKKNLLAFLHVKSSLHSCGLYFFKETDWRTIEIIYVRKRWGLGKCSLNENCFSQDDPDRSLFPFTAS